MLWYDTYALIQQNIFGIKNANRGFSGKWEMPQANNLK